MLASSNGKDGCLQLLIAAEVDLEAKDNVSECMLSALICECELERGWIDGGGEGGV